MVMMTGSLAVRGTVLWLTPQQGGRVSGPPEPDYDYDYTATAYLPPRTPEDGQAGIALRRFAPGAWRTPAEGILVPAKGNRAQQVIPGCIVIITEGVRPVGLLTVEEVHALAPDGTPIVTSAPVVDVVADVPAATDPAPADPPYRHSTAASRWASKHASDDAPPQTAGV
ncbi:hypothetical protein [Kribbella jiaozuonensis]|uniref:Uncharacterized protein n=1 Tax=Kribbella jiaozuonensis TaxID=2575441 RepID=A0A4U3LUW1_9ACTN|nr:hypothetical protein [Kribbella jiaozuonensis]TKK79309.1 hypothetical protein FDA38_12885 [Kribbella jiaozuonensis]